MIKPIILLSFLLQLHLFVYGQDLESQYKNTQNYEDRKNTAIVKSKTLGSQFDCGNYWGSFTFVDGFVIQNGKSFGQYTIQNDKFNFSWSELDGYDTKLMYALAQLNFKTKIIYVTYRRQNPAMDDGTIKTENCIQKR